jgi:hypothetical protein
MTPNEAGMFLDHAIEQQRTEPSGKKSKLSEDQKIALLKREAELNG